LLKAASLIEALTALDGTSVAGVLHATAGGSRGEDSHGGDGEESELGEHFNRWWLREIGLKRVVVCVFGNETGSERRKWVFD
jgi:hypothetical protein